MKKFVAVLLSTLTLIATLFALSGCSYDKNSKTKKEWIKYAIEKSLFNEESYAEYDFEFKKIKKFSKYTSPLVYDRKNDLYVYGEKAAYKVEVYRYTKKDYLNYYSDIYYIGVEDCDHCNNFLRFGENKKYCRACVKYIAYSIMYMEF